MSPAAVVLLLSVAVPPADEKLTLAVMEKALLEAANAARAKEKLPPLARDAKLDAAAKAHAANMARQGKLEHALDGKRVGDRVTAAGYEWKSVRENLAVAEGDKDAPAAPPSEIHDNWMKSKGHRDNILSAKVTQTGLAVVRAKSGAYYYAVVFAAPEK